MLAPLAAILPLATLSVENVPHFDYDLVPVPTINFSSTSMIDNHKAVMRAANGSYLYSDEIIAFVGQSERLARLASITALQSRIQDLPSIGYNKTYQSRFLGSALQCKNVFIENSDRFNAFLGENCDLLTVFNTSYRERQCGLPSSFAYYLWSLNSTYWTGVYSLDDMNDYGTVRHADFGFT